MCYTIYGDIETMKTEASLLNEKLGDRHKLFMIKKL